MSTEFTNEDNVQQQMTRDDIATNLEFLRAAGLLDAPLTLPVITGHTSDNDASGNNDGLAISGLTEAVIALARGYLGEDGHVREMAGSPQIPISYTGDAKFRGAIP